MDLTGPAACLGSEALSSPVVEGAGRVLERKERAWSSFRQAILRGYCYTIASWRAVSMTSAFDYTALSTVAMAIDMYHSG